MRVSCVCPELVLVKSSVFIWRVRHSSFPREEKRNPSELHGLAAVAERRPQALSVTRNDGGPPRRSIRHYRPCRSTRVDGSPAPAQQHRLSRQRECAGSLRRVATRLRRASSALGRTRLTTPFPCSCVGVGCRVSGLQVNTQWCANLTGDKCENGQAAFYYSQVRERACERVCIAASRWLCV
jgi:hypothetical protein